MLAPGSIGNNRFFHWFRVLAPGSIGEGPSGAGARAQFHLIPPRFLPLVHGASARFPRQKQPLCLLPLQFYFWFMVLAPSPIEILEGREARAEEGRGWRRGGKGKGPQSIKERRGEEAEDERRARVEQRIGHWDMVKGTSTAYTVNANNLPASRCVIKISRYQVPELTPPRFRAQQPDISSPRTLDFKLPIMFFSSIPVSWRHSFSLHPWNFFPAGFFSTEKVFNEVCYFLYTCWLSSLSSLSAWRTYVCTYLSDRVIIIMWKKF